MRCNHIKINSFSSWISYILLYVNVIIYYIVTLVFFKRIKVIFSIFTISEFVEQRSAIKFCLRNEISIAETFRMLQKTFGDLAMSQKNVYKWYKDINWRATRQSNQWISDHWPMTISPEAQHISFHNHHIRLIWLCVTSGYCPNSKVYLKLLYILVICMISLPGIKLTLI